MSATTPAIGSGAWAAPRPATLPTMKPPRELPALILNFMDESGAITNIVDLETHKATSRVHVTNAIVQELADLIPNMTSLNINTCFEVTDIGLWALSRSCTRLMELKMSGLPSVSHVGLRNLGLMCKGMRVLDMSHCPLVDDLAVRIVAANWWQLRAINLSGTKATDSALAELAACCQALNSVNLSAMRHVGDHALTKLAQHCTALTKLNVCDTRFVKGPGLVAVARNCHDLASLNLANCVAPEPEVFMELGAGCPAVTELDLPGCVKLTDAALRAMLRAMTGLIHLDVSGCVKVGRPSAAAMAAHSVNLADLHLRGLPKFSQPSAAALVAGCTALRSLDLSGCEKVGEKTVRTIVGGLSRLTSLKLNSCRRVTRPFVKALAEELPYVQNAKTFLGLEGLPDADARIYLTELHRAQEYAVIHIQRMFRGRLARDWVAELRRRLKEGGAVLTMQRVWRGHLDRVKVATIRLVYTEDEAVLMIQSCARGWLGRAKVRRLKFRLRMLARRNRKATIIQAGARRYWARCLRHRLADEKFLREQAARRLAAKQHKCATIIQGGFKIYRARCLVLAMKEAIRRAAALLARQTAATIQIQRLSRGHLARQQFRAMKAFVALMVRQSKAALFVQTRVRRYLATKEANRRRWQRLLKQRWEAAIKIQRSFRGSRGRHIFAIMLSLAALRAVENKASVVIQTKYRTYRARYFLWTIRQAQARQRELEHHACVIQRAYRGLKGRQFAEIAMNLREVRALSAPLQDAIRALEEEARGVNRDYATTQARIVAQEENILAWEGERAKLALWTKKEYDTDKLTGVMQRFETAFIAEQLLMQLGQFHVNLNHLKEKLVTEKFKVHDVGRRLRGKRRELMPLERGIFQRTLDARRKRLADFKALQQASAARIQGLVRGRQTRRKLRMGLIPAPEEVAVADVDVEMAEWAEDGQWDGYTGEEEGGWWGQEGAGDTVAALPAAEVGEEPVWEATDEQAQYYEWQPEQWDDYWGEYGADGTWQAEQEDYSTKGYYAEDGTWVWYDTEGYAADGAGGYATSPEAAGGYAASPEGYAASPEAAGGFTGFPEPGSGFAASPDAHPAASPDTAVTATDVPSTTLALAAAADAPMDVVPALVAASAGGLDTPQPSSDTPMPSTPSQRPPATPQAAADSTSTPSSAAVVPASAALAPTTPPPTATPEDSTDIVPAAPVSFPQRRKYEEEKPKIGPIVYGTQKKKQLRDLERQLPLPDSMHAAAGPRPMDSCVPRDPDTGLPKFYIPKLLRHKLATVDRESYPYPQRRMHIAFLRFKLEEDDFLKVSGVADQIIALQRDMRGRRDEMLAKKAEADAEAARVRAIFRRQEDLLGMHHADLESKAAAEYLKKQMKAEKARRAKAEANRLANDRIQMAVEEELSTRVDLAFRTRMEDQARRDARALEKANRRRDRADMVGAARECRGWNDTWQEEYRAFAEFNRKVGAAETDAMEDIEQESLVMNRIWQRIGRAKDFTRTRQKQIAARKARLEAGLPSEEGEEEGGEEGEPETEEQAERRAVKELLRLKGVDVPDSDASDGEAAAGAGEEEPLEDGGPMEVGRSGWEAFADDDGYIYYAHESGATQWERPEDF